MLLLPARLLARSDPWALAAKRKAGNMLLGSMSAGQPLSQAVLRLLLLLLLLLHVLQLPLGCRSRA
jgi:hypothetical protein